ncbi:MAG: translocation/assembly module TamB domain-containing protein [Rikenellaceae bacterium]
MIVSATILLLILLPIFLSLLLSLPIVQNIAVGFATEMLTKHIGSEVRVGRVDLTMKGYLDLKEVLVRDLQSDTLLYVDQLKSRVEGFSYSRNALSLGQTSINGARLNMQERESGDMNIREVILKISSQKVGKKSLIVEVSGVKLDNLDLTIARLEKLNPEYGVDMRNMQIQNMSAAIQNLTIDGSMIHAQVESMSGLEQSGFEVKDLGGELYITSGAISLTDMKLDSRWSSLRLNHLSITDRDWGAYRDFNNSTQLDIEVSEGYISSDDVAYFAPALRDWGIALYDLEFTFDGNVNDMELDIENAQFGDETLLSASIKCRGVTSPSTAQFETTLHGLTTVASDIDQIVAATTKKGLSAKQLSQLSALGHIVVRGSASGEQSKIAVEGSLVSEAGDADTKMTISQSETASTHLLGDLRVENLEVGKILSNNDFGATSLHISMDGYIGEKDRNLRINSEVEQMQWRDYPLHNISLHSHITPYYIGADVVCRDPKLQFDLRAHGSSLRSKKPKYDAVLDIAMADLKALNINRRDTTSQLSTLIKLSAEGSSVEDCSARMVMESGRYLYDSKSVESSNAVLVVQSHEEDRSVIFTSEFADASFHSTNSVEHIMEYLQGAISPYLPSLYDQKSEQRYNMSTMFGEEYKAMSRKRAQEIGLDTYSLSQLSFAAHNITPISEAISEGLQMGEGTKASLDFNIARQHFDLKFRSGFIEYRSALAIGVELQATNQGDSIAFTTDVRELFVGTSFMNGAKLRAKVKSNRVDINAGFENTTDDSSANLGATLDFSRTAMGRQDIAARLHPSSIHRRGEVWQLSARGVDITERGIDIDYFKMESRDQLMTLNGVASNSLSDTVRMQMHNFDLSILSSVISRLGYNIEGRTNGEVIASSALNNARLEAHVDLDSIRVNTIPAPAMSMNVDWDFKLNRARLFLSDRAKRDTLIRGYYIPSQVRYYAKLDVDSVNMGLLDPPLGGVITDTKGYANLDLRLQGERRNADLSGTIGVHDLSTRVAYTNVSYSIPEATITVNNNLLSGLDARMYDQSGGSGRMSVTVDLQHLSNIKYDLKIMPENMMVLNTSVRDNDLFYGGLYASGAATISGDRSGVRMNITASSAGNSHFFMPLSNKSTISTADFITFVTPTITEIESHITQRRQLFERKTKGQSSAGALTINMALDVRPNTEMQLVIDPTVGDVIKVRGEGRLNLKIEPQSNIFEIYGDYTIDEGSYLFTLQNIVNKRFEIDSGSSIQWTGSPTNALLNIDAVYKLKTSLQPLFSDESSRSVPVDCIIHLGDRLTNPDVSFNIELPSSDPEQQAALANLLNDQESISRQFFYLMLANSFIPDSSGMGSDFGVTTTATTGFELLTNQLSNWLSSSNYNVVIRYRPESELTDEEVDFGFSKGLINNRLLVELEGNYIIDNKQAISEDASNFMGEAYITWLIDRAGALRLKGFTQTIDRYDENQGLQETGIGVYYREDFNNFQDLRTRVRARFSANPARKKEREERKNENK